MSVYKYKNGYRLDFRVNAPTKGEKPVRVSRVYPTKTEAQHAERQLREQLTRARAKGRTLPDQQITLAEALSDWFDESQKAIKKGIPLRHLAPDAQQENSRRKKLSESHLGSCRLIDLSLSHIESFIDDQRENDRSEGTIRNDLKPLNRFYKFAESRWKWELSNPVPEALKDVGKSGKRNRRLSTDEHDRLINVFEQLEQAQRQYTPKQRQRIVIETDNGRTLDIQSHPSLLYIRTAFMAAIECAMRRGKMFEMHWSWIDWKTENIVVPNQMQGPSNKEVPSHVPMSPALLRALKTLRGPRQIGAALDTPIFGRLTGDRAYRLLRAACEALEIHDFRWHDLRHEACSRLADRGWTALQIQAVSGHKTLQSLERYVHSDTETTHQLFKRDEAMMKNGTHF